MSVSNQSVLIDALEWKFIVIKDTCMQSAIHLSFSISRKVAKGVQFKGACCF